MLALAGVEDAGVEEEAGAEGLTAEVEAVAAGEEACLAFHFVQFCLRWPVVWQKKHRCSAMYSFRSSSVRKPPSRFRFLVGCLLRLFGLPILTVVALLCVALALATRGCGSAG